MDRRECAERDRDDPLAAWREQFVCPDGITYLDGHSLGPLPRSGDRLLRRVVGEEWGVGLIRSWNSAHWIDAPSRVGEKLARLIGAPSGSVIVADSTSVNMFKLLVAGLRLRPNRRVILTERENFPTDIYVAEGLVHLLGDDYALRIVHRNQLESAIDERVAVLALTHVDYATGALHDMIRLTNAAHRAGALALWDLSHSAGAVPLDMYAADVDLAVGCGYKYLNGGPGAPAYCFVAPRWQPDLESPLTGWMGHAAPFAFEPHYRPAPGIGRLQAGTPPIISLAGLEAGVDLWLQVDREVAWNKVRDLGDLFIGLLDAADGFDLAIASPRQADRRGGHVAVRHPEAYRVMRALIDQGVIGDVRKPDLMRFGFAPLSTRFVDVWDAVDRLHQVLRSRAWARPEYTQSVAVT